MWSTRWDEPSTRPAKNISGIGSGMSGDEVMLSPDYPDPPIVLSMADAPGLTFDPSSQLARNFEEFLERLLGASFEGRTELAFWL